MKPHEIPSFTDLLNPDKDFKAVSTIGVNCWTGKVNEGTMPGRKGYVFTLSSAEFDQLASEQKLGFGKNGNDFVSRGEDAEPFVAGKKQALNNVLGEES